MPTKTVLSNISDLETSEVRVTSAGSYERGLEVADDLEAAEEDCTTADSVSVGCE